ncbi:hypothetical protein MMC18_000450 [Xylographa bjoerkii]|nr:hypothetical protein [Xylographa bjoerkii]
MLHFCRIFCSYVVVHDKIYNASTFVDEHPGGEEVLLDVGGQDATEAFEDVGHSDEAREILEGLLVGTLKRAVCFAPFVLSSPQHTKQLLPTTFTSDPGDPEPSTAGANTTAKSTTGSTSSAAGMGVGLYAAILVGGALAFGAYKYMQAKSDS